MKKIILNIILANLSISIAFSQVQIQDSLALVDLYNNTNGASWNNNNNWLTSSPIKTWHGVLVSTKGIRVIQLNLASNNLAGNLPSSFGDLTSLNNINLSYNSLNGSVPSTIGNLTKAQALWLNNNSFTGNIPSTITNLEALIYLGLNDNNFNGSLPNGYSGMPALRYFYAHNNQLTGSLPQDLSDAQNLVEAWLYSNSFTGNIPNSYLNLINLKALGLNNNNLEGIIPDFSATMNSLEWVFLNNNNFTDVTGLSNSINLSFYDLSNNKLKFSILEPIVVNIPAEFYYSDQDSIDNQLDTSLISGGNINLSVSDNAINNTYLWFKDGVAISGATNSTYSITDFNKFKEGSYTCRIRNTILPNLDLFRRNINITLDTPEPTICGNYQYNNVYIPSTGTKFYVDFIANSNVPSGIIGLDICLGYDPALLEPTGKMTKEDVWDGGNWKVASKRFNIDNINGTVNMGMYFDQDASNNQQFNGAGKITRIEFISKTDLNVSSNISICGIDEGYTTNVLSYCVPANKSAENNNEKEIIAKNSKIISPLNLKAKLRYWGIDNKPLRYDALNPDTYLKTEGSTSDVGCNNLTNTVVNSIFGNLHLNFSNETNFHIKRDIEGDFINNSNCTSVSNEINFDDVEEIMKIVVKNPLFTPRVEAIISADVNMDGMIRSNDATLAWKRFSDKICEFPQAWNYDNTGIPINEEVSYDWLFFDEDELINNSDYMIDVNYPESSGSGYSRNFVPFIDNCLLRPSTTNSTITKTYHAILIGDVNHSWSTTDGAMLRESSEDNSLDEIQNSYSIDIYNNPTTSGRLAVSINNKSDKEIRYQLVNTLGIVIQSGNFNYSNVLEIINLPKGNYWITTTNGDEIISKQLIFL